MVVPRLQFLKSRGALVFLCCLVCFFWGGRGQKCFGAKMHGKSRGVRGFFGGGQPLALNGVSFFGGCVSRFKVGFGGGGGVCQASPAKHKAIRIAARELPGGERRGAWAAWRGSRLDAGCCAEGNFGPGAG